MNEKPKICGKYVLERDRYGTNPTLYTLYIVDIVYTTEYSSNCFSYIAELRVVETNDRRMKVGSIERRGYPFYKKLQLFNEIGAARAELFLGML